MIPNQYEGAGEVIIRKATVGFNSVNFFLDKALTPGTYSLFVIIGGMTVPLETETADKKIVPAAITVPDKALPKK